LIKSEILRI